jgi:ABC-2 type transport system ATP-binding protein
MLYRNLTGLENLEYFSALAGRPDYTRSQLLAFRAPATGATCWVDS